MTHSQAFSQNSFNIKSSSSRIWRRPKCAEARKQTRRGAFHFSKVVLNTVSQVAVSTQTGSSSRHRLNQADRNKRLASRNTQTASQPVTRPTLTTGRVAPARPTHLIGPAEFRRPRPPLGGVLDLQLGVSLPVYLCYIRGVTRFGSIFLSAAGESTFQHSGGRRRRTQRRTSAPFTQLLPQSSLCLSLSLSLSLFLTHTHTHAQVRHTPGFPLRSAGSVMTYSHGRRTSEFARIWRLGAVQTLKELFQNAVTLINFQHVAPSVSLPAYHWCLWLILLHSVQLNHSSPEVFKSWHRHLKHFV